MLDIFIFLFIIFGGIRGYFTGFVLQSLTLVALFGGIWAGIKYNPIVSSYLPHLFEVKESVAPYISFTIIFLVVIVIVHLLGMLCTKVIDKSALGVMNRIGGVLFGIVKILFILSICLFLIRKVDKKRVILSDNCINGSYLYEPVAKIAPAIFPPIYFEKIKRGMLNGKG